MKIFALLALSCFLQRVTLAGNRDSTIYFPLADSIRAVSILADVQLSNISGRKTIIAGIQTHEVRLTLEKGKKTGTVNFHFPAKATVVATGMDLSAVGNGKLSWSLSLKDLDTYTLFITSAADSAGNFMLYSGYIRMPRQPAWKLIGTCRIEGQSITLKNPSAFYSSGNHSNAGAVFPAAWCQRINGTWKNMNGSAGLAPVLPPFTNIDSVRQSVLDIKKIETTLGADSLAKLQQHEGIYYTILRQGTGGPVTVSDTLTVNYKGWLFNDGIVFDQTKDKPARFPLNRLIPGWQLGLPLCRVGGKIRLLIPSGIGYGIRTRGPKIPPNSTLVFDIDVLDAKPKN